MSTRNLVRLLPALTLLLLLPSCGSFGRKFNQGLPEFLRSDPGADELARYRERVRVLKRTKEEADEARVAFERCRDFFDEGDYENANTALVDYLKQYPDTTDDKEARFLLIKARLGDEAAGRAHLSEMLGEVQTLLGKVR